MVVTSRASGDADFVGFNHHRHGAAQVCRLGTERLLIATGLAAVVAGSAIGGVVAVRHRRA